ncbi:MAG TPA: indole-3-glycerol-phosphate synthase TrpC, partial [Nitrospinae bacterium]|nr:indole-3-glycerol-phosphate synthase TrpC [Nitrospinota bacterium]
MTIRTKTVLDDLVEGVREDMASARGRLPIGELRSRTADMPETQDFGAGIRRPAQDASGGGGRIQVIAEIKRVSPSQGAISEEANPAEVALRYAEGGAAA